MSFKMSTGSQNEAPRSLWAAHPEPSSILRIKYTALHRAGKAPGDTQAEMPRVVPQVRKDGRLTSAVSERQWC